MSDRKDKSGFLEQKDLSVSLSLTLSPLSSVSPLSLLALSLLTFSSLSLSLSHTVSPLPLSLLTLSLSLSSHEDVLTRLLNHDEYFFDLIMKKTLFKLNKHCCFLTCVL